MSSAEDDVHLSKPLLEEVPTTNHGTIVDSPPTQQESDEEDARPGSPVRTGSRRKAGRDKGDEMTTVDASSNGPSDEGPIRGETNLTAIASTAYVATDKRPKRVSNYLLGPVMGEGQYGVVRDALDMSSGRIRRVAIKIIRTKHRRPHEMELLEKILSNEAHHLQRFHHPNVVRAIDVFSDREGKRYMTLPVAVCSLQQLLDVRYGQIAANGGKCSESQISLASVDNASFVSNSSSKAFKFTSGSLLPTQLVKDMVFQMLCGVAYLHTQGICHNDLKFGNVLLYADGTLKLTDLGGCSAEFNGRATTPAFVSPTVAAGVEGETVNGKANDIWAIGVMLYYLVTTKMPFDVGVCNGAPVDPDVNPSTEMALYSRITNASVNIGLVAADLPESGLGSGSPKTPATPETSPTVVEGTLRHLISRMLEKDQSKRITATEALMHPWLTSGPIMDQRRESGLGQSSSPGSRSIAYTATASGSDEGTSRTLQMNISSGSLKRVFNVKEIGEMLDDDAARHLQFIADFSHILALPLPPALFDANSPTTNFNLHDPNVTKTFRFASMAGSVERGRFLAVDEFNHYARKGKPECDVKTLRFDPNKRQALQNYANHYYQLHNLLDMGIGSSRDASSGGSSSPKKAAAKKGGTGCPCVVS